MKITEENTVVAPKRVSASLKMLSIPTPSVEPKNSETEITIYNANTQPIISKSEGKTVNTTVTIPKIPTVLFIREGLISKRNMYH